MTRLTNRDVAAAFKRVALHYEPERLELHEGNKPAGRPWRLHVTIEGSTGLAGFPGLDDGFLGWTRREAYQTLRGIEAGWEAATRHWAVRLRRRGHERLDLLDQMLPPGEF